MTHQNETCTARKVEIDWHEIRGKPEWQLRVEATDSEGKRFTRYYWHRSMAKIREFFVEQFGSGEAASLLWTDAFTESVPAEERFFRFISLPAS